MRFQEGDRVVLILEKAGGVHNVLPPGSEGTVLYVDDYNKIIRVRWDNAFEDGHTCGGRCENGHGWNVFEKEIDFALSVSESDSIDISSIL